MTCYQCGRQPGDVCRREDGCTAQDAPIHSSFGAQLGNATDHVRAERDQLRNFVAALFEANEWPDGGDIDGFTFQDLCAAHGILVPETRTQPCREGCWCDEYHGGEEGMRKGVECFRKPQWLLDHIRKQANK